MCDDVEMMECDEVSAATADPTTDNQNYTSVRTFPRFLTRRPAVPLIKVSHHTGKQMTTTESAPQESSPGSRMENSPSSSSNVQPEPTAPNNQLVPHTGTPWMNSTATHLDNLVHSDPSQSVESMLAGVTLEHPNRQRSELEHQTQDEDAHMDYENGNDAVTIPVLFQRNNRSPTVYHTGFTAPLGSSLGDIFNQFGRDYAGQPTGDQHYDGDAELEMVSTSRNNRNRRERRGNSSRLAHPYRGSYSDSEHINIRRGQNHHESHTEVPNKGMEM